VIIFKGVLNLGTCRKSTIPTETYSWLRGRDLIIIKIKTLLFKLYVYSWLRGRDLIIIKIKTLLFKLYVLDTPEYTDGNRSRRPHPRMDLP